MASNSSGNSKKEAPKNAIDAIGRFLLQASTFVWLIIKKILLVLRAVLTACGNGLRGISNWLDRFVWISGPKKTLYEYYILTRLNKPIGIFLLLWPTLWALWIAGEGHPDLLVLVVFVAGVVLMRSAGCVINDYADRNIDPYVERTQNRPIAAGRVSPHEALVLFTVLALIAFGLVLLMNTLTIMLSIVAVMLAVTYPFLKRYTYLPQVVLGAAFGWAIPMAFAAQTGAIPQAAWLLLTATVLWATAYDTMYAMVDRDDDVKIGVKSTAILFGDLDRVIIGIMQVLVLLALYMVGKNLELSYLYFAGLATAAILAMYQQMLIKDRIKDLCFSAFLNNNWFGFAVFAGIALHYFVYG